MKAECCKFSGDVKFFAEYQTSIRHFYPWLSSAGLYIFRLTFILKAETNLYIQAQDNLNI